jgi:glycoside/pentoside/hexuronide:cation symporter, GPH family
MEGAAVSFRTTGPSVSAKPMKLSLKEKIGYGLGDTASNLIWATLMSFMMIYYTDVFGISSAAVGAMFLFARAFDGAADFLMGALADRTRSRWGSFRPYLLWMCVPLALATVLTFTVPDLEARGKLIYAWITYHLLMVTYTAVNIPYSALSAVMTDDPSDRTSLNSYRMVLAQCGGLIVSGATLPLVAWLGKGDRALGYQLTAALFAVAVVGLLLVTFATTRERVQPAPVLRSRLADDLRGLFSNRHWIVLFLVAMADLTFIIARSGTLVYHTRYVMGMDEAGITRFLLLGNAGFILGAAATRPLTAAAGRKTLMIAAHLVMAATAAGVFWLPPSMTGAITALQIVHSAAAGTSAVLFFSMIADAADYSEWKSGVRTTGIVFSATTCAQKIGMGVGGALAGLLLTRFGYVANAVQSPQAAQGILLLVSLIPAAGFLGVAALFSRYGLTEKVCHDIAEDLAARRSA